MKNPKELEEALADLEKDNGIGLFDCGKLFVPYKNYNKSLFERLLDLCFRKGKTKEQ